jgi:hypothetical protein
MDALGTGTLHPILGRVTHDDGSTERRGGAILTGVIWVEPPAAGDGSNQLSARLRWVNVVVAGWLFRRPAVKAEPWFDEDREMPQMIGLIALGAIGMPMALRLTAADHAALLRAEAPIMPGPPAWGHLGNGAKDLGPAAAPARARGPGRGQAR